MARQDKQARLTQLLHILRRGIRLTVRTLAQQLGLTPRTVYSYLDQLRLEGYAIEQDAAHRYFLALSPTEDNVRLTLNRRQAAWLLDMLPNLPGSASTDGEIGFALAQSLSLPHSGNQQWYHHLSEVMDGLHHGLAAKQRIILHDYHSGHGQTVRDRRVEPLLLNPSATVLVCYELDDQQVKNFLVSRIRRVTLLNVPIGYQGEVPVVDFFGYSGSTTYPVSLALDIYAYNHLIEGYHDVASYVRPDRSDPDFPYRFDINCRHLEGIGRYVLSMPGHLQILAPQELRAYVQDKSKWWEG
jgi:predicted DNA-binding transcriptional regulator YafY